MTGLLVAGTSSDAGKSLVVTGLCRALARRGIDVAPYKAQNMSNNSMVTSDGGEIGRAQYLQAQAAGVEATTLMNPVLLKPGSDRSSHVVLRGRPHGVLRSGQYATGRRELAEAAFAAYEELAAAHELVVCEGAGSPAEVNLRAGDYVNMGLARRFDLPVVLVGDIDRGGVLAALYGTWALLDEADRALLAGYVINKFRGDGSVLEPGLRDISTRTDMHCFGVLPWLEGVWLDGEDALNLGSFHRANTLDPVEPQISRLRVAVVALPRISNATDADALAQEPGVEVTITTDPAVCETADLVVLPGTRSTAHDYTWLRSTGLAEVIAARHDARRPVLGICGGYQMLARTISDPEGIEGAPGRLEGLGLLPVDVAFDADKVLRRPMGQWRGHLVEGYEIHHGTCRVDAEALDMAGSSTGEPDAEDFLDGVRVGATWGTLWHGSLENDAFRRAWLAEVARQAGRPWRPHPSAPAYAARREAMVDQLADAVERHVDMGALLALVGR